jgi:hypothetical protein
VLERVIGCVMYILFAVEYIGLCSPALIATSSPLYGVLVFVIVGAVTSTIVELPPAFSTGGARLNLFYPLSSRWMIQIDLP